MFSQPDFLTFASDADILAIWGIGFLLVAAVAMLMERRRLKRARIDRIGWVPWTGIFMASAVIGASLLVIAVPPLLQG